MTKLVDALRALALEGEIDLSGRWVTAGRARCPLYVSEATRGVGYYAWCGCPEVRTVEYYPDPSHTGGPSTRGRGTTAEATDTAAMGAEQLETTG